MRHEVSIKSHVYTTTEIKKRFSSAQNVVKHLVVCSLMLYNHECRPSFSVMIALFMHVH